MGKQSQQQRDWMRSCPFQELLPLFEIPEIHWVCLQKEVSPSDRDAVASCKQLERVSLDDFAATAAQVSGLDLLISVDTSVAHLVRALIVPVWILFAMASDWRWLLDHDDSPWYPSPRLFRQREVGDCKEVVRHVSEELRKRVVSDELRVKLLLSIQHSVLSTHRLTLSLVTALR